MKESKRRGAARRRWIIRLMIIIEIIFMAIGVACMLFPPRWQVFTLILLGAREIMFKAHTRMKYADKQESEGIIDYGKEKRKDNNREENRGKDKRQRGKARNAEPKGRE